MSEGSDDELRKSSTAALPPVAPAAPLRVTAEEFDAVEGTLEELDLSIEFARAMGDEAHAERLERVRLIRGVK